MTPAGRCRPSGKFEKRADTEGEILNSPSSNEAAVRRPPQRTRIRAAGARLGSDDRTFTWTRGHSFSTRTAAAVDLLQLNLLPSIITPVWHYGICAEKKCVSIQLAPSKTNTTCHSGLSRLS